MVTAKQRLQMTIASLEATGLSQVEITSRVGKWLFAAKDSNEKREKLLEDMNATRSDCGLKFRDYVDPDELEEMMKEFDSVLDAHTEGFTNRLKG